jgi:hypothetical protein
MPVLHLADVFPILLLLAKLKYLDFRQLRKTLLTTTALGTSTNKTTTSKKKKYSNFQQPKKIL